MQIIYFEKNGDESEKKRLNKRNKQTKCWGSKLQGGKFLGTKNSGPKLRDPSSGTKIPGDEMSSNRIGLLIKSRGLAAALRQH